MEDTEMDIILSAVDNASDTFESVQSAAEGMGESVQEGAESGSEGLDDMEASAEAAADPLEQITTIIGGLAGAEIFSQLADTLWDFADKAGTFEDSLMRARLEAEGAGISVNDMTDTVSELGRVTGRAGGEIREAFITATARGITDLDSFKQMMVGAGAQATLLGTDIDSMANKMSGLAMRSSVMERTLANTGITVEELGNALGIQGATIDDINAKWETMDTNQRAAALGMAASMNEGKTANEEYKKSWAGLQEQIDIAKGRLERIAGEVLLPVLIPALETAARVLTWVGDTVQSVMDGPFGGLLSVIGTVAAAFALAIPAFMAVSAAYDFIAGSALVAAAAELIALWPIALIAAALAALTYVVYEVGKAFGWWTDVSSMIDAIWAGIQRLWSAFINHPDVQSFLSALTAAWNWLVPAVSGVVNAVLKFFGVSSSSNFDIVAMWINNVSMAWEAMKAPIVLVINAIKLVINWFRTTYAQGKANIEKVKALFRALPGAIRSAVSTLVSIISKPFKDAYNKIKSTVEDIKTKVRSIGNISLSSITNAITKPFKDAYDSVVKWVDKIKKKAKEATKDIPIVGGFLGGEDLNFYGGEDLTSYSTEKLSVDMNQNINLSLDLRNVPSSMDERQLAGLINETLDSKEFINRLVNNPDFQSLDSKVKQRIVLKSNRANGRGV